MNNSQNLRFIVHVGFFKTGTTTLQEWAFQKFPDIIYFGKPSPKVIGQSLSKPGSRTLLYSDETVLGHLLTLFNKNRNKSISWSTIQIQAMERLARRFPGIEIIFSVRKHASWILSIYKHYLRYGGSLPPNDFFNFQETGIMLPSDFEIAPRLEAAKFFFENRVHILQLESFINDPELVLKKLGAFLGSSGPSYQNLREIPKFNEGVSSEFQAKIIRSLNAAPLISCSDNFLQKNDMLARFLRRKKLTPFFLSEKIKNLPLKKSPVSFDKNINKEIEKYYFEDSQKIATILANQDHII